MLCFKYLGTDIPQRRKLAIIQGDNVHLVCLINDDSSAQVPHSGFGDLAPPASNTIIVQLLKYVICQTCSVWIGQRCHYFMITMKATMCRRNMICVGWHHNQTWIDTCVLAHTCSALPYLPALKVYIHLGHASITYISHSWYLPCCTTKLTGFNGSRYTADRMMLTWSDAAARCREFGNGELARITSQAEQDFVALTFTGFDFWIGLRNQVRFTLCYVNSCRKWVSTVSKFIAIRKIVFNISSQDCLCRHETLSNCIIPEGVNS